MKGVTAVTIIAIALIAAAAYVSINNNPNPEPAVTIATIQFGISTLDIIDSGIYNPQNIRINVMRIQLAPDVATALIKGDAQVAILPVEVAAKLYQKGENIKVIAVDMYQNQAILIPKDSDIKDPSQLKGKTIASPLTSGTFAVFKSYMKNLYNYSVGEENADIRVLNSKPAQVLDAVKTGDADAAVIWEPIVSQALALNDFRILTSFQDMWKMSGHEGKPVMIVWVARGDWVADHPDQVEALLDARESAAQIWLKNKDKVILALEELYHLDKEVASTLYDRVDICGERAITPSLTENIRQVLDLAVQGGYLDDKPIDLVDFLYYSAEE